MIPTEIKMFILDSEIYQSSYDIMPNIIRIFEHNYRKISYTYDYEKQETTITYSLKEVL